MFVAESQEWPVLQTYYNYHDNCKGDATIWSITLESSIALLEASIGLHHPLDGVTNPEYKLLRFIQLNKFFAKRRRH
jgi:hypothetical protein